MLQTAAVVFLVCSLVDTVSYASAHTHARALTWCPLCLPVCPLSVRPDVLPTLVTGVNVFAKLASSISRETASARAAVPSLLGALDEGEFEEEEVRVHVLLVCSRCKAF